MLVDTVPTYTRLVHPRGSAPGSVFRLPWLLLRSGYRFQRCAVHEPLLGSQSAQQYSQTRSRGLQLKLDNQCGVSRRRRAYTKLIIFFQATDSSHQIDTPRLDQKLFSLACAQHRHARSPLKRPVPGLITIRRTSSTTPLLCSSLVAGACASFMRLFSFSSFSHLFAEQCSSTGP